MTKATEKLLMEPWIKWLLLIFTMIKYTIKSFQSLTTFNEDGKSIVVKYLTGANYEVVTETLEL